MGDSDKLTPAMQQFMQIKNQYKDCVVFFRMGDFYETFYDDAVTASKALDITLTKRGIKNSGQYIPLAGIPYHALDTYLAKMIKKGFKVVIVEQLEDPKFAKGIVKRGVTRIVTPGTIIEEKMLSKSNNFVASVSINKFFGLSFMDLSTGEFFTTQLNSTQQVVAELKKYSPQEIIIPMSYETHQITEDLKDFYLSMRSDVDFYFDNAKEMLIKHFGDESLNSFGFKSKEYSVCSSGALLSYLYETQKNSLSHINKIKFYENADALHIDHSTINNLEIFDEKQSLFKIMDKTLTSMGSRFLKKVLIRPLIDMKKINERLLAVEELIKMHFVNEELRQILKNISDLERLIGRINYGNSNPRDLVMLHGSLDLLPKLKDILSEVESTLLFNLGKIPLLNDICELIDSSIIDEPPALINDGNFIKDGYDTELDDLRKISRDAKLIIRKLEENEKISTGIKSLKIRYNRIFGYFIDITKSNIHLAPDHYIKKQTLVNSERFITQELKELEEKILTAQERIVKIEEELFLDIVNKIKLETVNIQDIAARIAYLDLLSSFAVVSLTNNYVKPIITDTYKIVLRKSRHPIVEQLTDFISNDISIDKDNRMMIITGPNMAGKSVFMKQVALNIIMAQCGCFVPCESAQIGIVDKIFSRTGASDDIALGHSTFMVEMSETAQILNNATEKSLIILDEIGRGTSTYDGVAIAWAVSEYLAIKIKAKTLFATHYHVLNKLEKQYQFVKNYNIAVTEKNDKVIFLRKIIKGGTDKSYGIHVAKLAGMPKSVIDKSKEIQFKLEADDEISEKIIIETRKSEEKDELSSEIEETERLIKSKQLRLDEI